MCSVLYYLLRGRGARQTTSCIDQDALDSVADQSHGRLVSLQASNDSVEEHGLTRPASPEASSWPTASPINRCLSRSNADFDIVFLIDLCSSRKIHQS
jgi:hypothetical protein